MVIKGVASPETLNYFQKPQKHNLSNLPHQIVEKLQKTRGPPRTPDW